MSEGFFSRWSRRKQEGAVQSSAQVPTQTPVETPAQTPSASGDVQPKASARVPARGPDAPVDEIAPTALPTLQDAQALTPASDFQPFMRTGVGAEVRNAAMKKLFTDPHFNVMDGLDIYIDDYSQADPLPAGMLRQMASAQFLKLVPSEDNLAEQGEAAQAAPQAGSEVVAQSPETAATAGPRCHDHPDLQLQPDPAPADPPAEPRAR